MITIGQVTPIRAPIERCFDLARSVEVHLAGNVHYGEQALAVGGATSGLLSLGDRVTWRAKHFFVWHELTSEISALRRPDYFQDVMLRGPFRSMRHDHFFRAMPAGGTEMRDVMQLAGPLPVIGRIAEIAFLGHYMRNLLRERNAVIRQLAESDGWRAYVS